MSKAGSGKGGWIRDIIIAAVLVAAVAFFLKPILVNQMSMYPTLHENDYVFLNRQAYDFGQPERGDIVVFPTEDGNTGEEILYVKRVIGLPGETVEIHDGHVWIDGVMLEEDYTADGYTAGEMEQVTVGAGRLFVMGDNRQDSLDSRMIGTIPIDSVVGEAFLRVWPLSRLGPV